MLAKAIAIHAWLEADQKTPHNQRVRRDRAVGQQFSSHNLRSRVLLWWQTVADEQAQTQGVRVERARRIISMVLAIAGFVIGTSVCTAALAYEGRYPVNLLAFLGVMLGIPLCFFLLSLLTSLLRQLGIEGLSAFVSDLRLNRWLMGLWDKLGGTGLGRNFARSNASGRLAYWQLHVFSQHFAIGFYIGALMAFVLLVAVTDLAFGWSTTLELTAQTVFTWANALALPWASLWPAAAPDLALVEVSQYFRLESELGYANAEHLGDWWPFVVMCLAVWGLAPRLLWLCLALWQVRRATSQFLLEHSEVTALLDRLDTPLLEPAQDRTYADQDQLGEKKELAVTTTATFMRDQVDAVLIWNSALPPSEAQALFGTILQLNSWDPAANEQVIAENIPKNATKLLVLVKGWEPPVFEFSDFLLSLFERYDELVSLVVMPIGVTPFEPAAADVQVWSSAMAKLNEPRIYVTTLGER